MKKFRLVMATWCVSMAFTSYAAEQCGYTFDDNNGPLTLAVCRGDLAKVKELVESQRMDVNKADPRGYTPLDVAFHSSVVYWNPIPTSMSPVIEYLLGKGANPNLRFVDGNLPLAAASYTGNMFLVPRLVAAGADVNARHGKGLTALHSAAVCDFRLSNDDSSTWQPQNKDEEFNKVWHMGAKPVIEYLVGKGADINAKTDDGKSVLQFVPTPCSFAPELCTVSSLASDTAWPTGSCKQTYLFVKAHQAK